LEFSKSEFEKRSNNQQTWNIESTKRFLFRLVLERAHWSAPTSDWLLEEFATKFCHCRNRIRFEISYNVNSEKLEDIQTKMIKRIK
jgi:hypothetical protein